MKRLYVAAFVAVGAVGVVAARADDAAKPKYTIKEVMKKAHQPDGGLLKKIVAGEGTKEDAAELVDLYTVLGQNKPPKGEPGSWQEKTGELLAAAKAVVENKDGSKERLKKAADCGNCHKEHKPPAQ
jgi:hypothetical protein